MPTGTTSAIHSYDSGQRLETRSGIHMLPVSCRSPTCDEPLQSSVGDLHQGLPCLQQPQRLRQQLPRVRFMFAFEVFPHVTQTICGGAPNRACNATKS